MSKETAAQGQVTVEALEQLLDAFNHHDLDRIMEFFSDDATFDMPRGADPWGNLFEIRDGKIIRKDSYWKIVG